VIGFLFLEVDTGGRAAGGNGGAVIVKRLMVIICAGLLALGLFAVVGCGGGTSKTTAEQSETISLDEDVATGLVGTYVEAGGGAGSIVFLKGGAFEGNAWGSEKKGKYVLEKTPEGFNTAVLTFDDSSAQEKWSIGIAMGKVAAVSSPEAVQYDKVVK
jgi:hypothetical protein